MVNDDGYPERSELPSAGEQALAGVSFDQFFRVALGGGPEVVPFEFQRELACGPTSLSPGAACLSRLIEIPTGCGKTAAVVLAWLWNRVARPSVSPALRWPRRLIYCLPAGALVDPTVACARSWISNLAKAYPGETLAWLAERFPMSLERNEAQDAWSLYPEREAIVIGTQDRLLSGALNRGFGQSPYRWPTLFALLNYDALWVMDEPALMGVGLETSAQLDAFRPAAGAGACRTWWMGASLPRARLATVDHSEPMGGWPSLSLGVEPGNAVLRRRWEAGKRLARADVVLGVGAKSSYARNLARFAREHRAEEGLTLVVLNTVERAQAVWRELEQRSLGTAERVGLWHESLLPQDRGRALEALHGAGARMVVTTASMEAGMDVSAKVLITELASWPALVQRFGRCNRYGEHAAGGDVYWIDGRYENHDLSKPYAEEEIAIARALLARSDDVGLTALRSVPYQPAPRVRPVLRQKDLLDLFDATPDLCGSEVDVLPHVADVSQAEVFVYWRMLSESAPSKRQPQPRPEELCRVSLAAFSRFIKLNARACPSQWDHLHGRWQKAAQPRAGGTYLIPLACGGYRDGVGWTGDRDDKPALPPASSAPGEERYDDNRESFGGEQQTWREHTEEVVRAARALADAVELPEADRSALIRAAWWHDVGKTHAEFQRMLRHGAEEHLRAGLCLARAQGAPRACRRPFYRHELASALAWLGAAPPAEPDRDLVAYLIAAHHGRIGLSIRPLPGEPRPEDEPERLCARGVWDGEFLAEADLPGAPSGPLALHLDIMSMGGGLTGESWVSRMIALRNRASIFRLAFLAALLRTADLRTARPTEPANRPERDGATADRPAPSPGQPAIELITE